MINSGAKLSKCSTADFIPDKIVCVLLHPPTQTFYLASDATLSLRISFQIAP